MVATLISHRKKKRREAGIRLRQFPSLAAAMSSHQGSSYRSSQTSAGEAEFLTDPGRDIFKDDLIKYHLANWRIGVAHDKNQMLGTNILAVSSHQGSCLRSSQQGKLNSSHIQQEGNFPIKTQLI